MNTPEIVIRNKEIENAVLASAKYGHHVRGVENAKKLFSILACADIHGDAERFSRYMDYLNYYPQFDAGICLGDIAPIAYGTEDGVWYNDTVMRSKKEFHTVLGNHDLGNSTDALLAATPDMAFRKFVYPTREKCGIENLDTPYYIRLYDEYKIALIVLNCYDAPSVLDDGGNYVIHRGEEAFSVEQVLWLIDTLGKIPNGYHLLLAMHTFPYSAKEVDSAFTQRCETPFAKPTLLYGDDNMISDIIDAWIHGTSLKREYEPKRYADILPIISIDCNFSGRGKGNFIAYMAGHRHRDILCRAKKYPEQNIIYFASSANDLWQNFCSDLPRAVGTRAEDLFTAVSVDTENRSIRLVRIGSDFTMDMRERRYISISY